MSLNEEKECSAKSFGGLAWIVWGLGAGLFFLQYFARVAPSVMKTDLMQAFSINGYGFGQISVFFYYSYIIIQIPPGLLDDRYGVKRLLIISILTAGVGCWMFGHAHSLYMAEYGRFLLGFGGTFGFVSGIKLASEWFDASRFGMLAGATQGLGMLGAAMGGVTISTVVSSLGWRNTMYAIAIAFVLLAVLIVLVVQDTPHKKKKRVAVQQGKGSFLSNLLTVCKNPQTWINGLYVGAIYAPTTIFAELWGVSYIHRVHAVPEKLAAIAVGAIFIGWAIGAPAVGWVSDRLGKRRPMLLMTALASAFFMGLVLYVPHIPYAMLLTLLFMYGLSNTGTSLSYAVAGEMAPRHLSGTSVAFANMASILIGALCQPLVGYLLDLQWHGRVAHGMRVYSAMNFKLAMLMLVGFLLLSAVLALFVRETHCRPVDHTG